MILNDIINFFQKRIFSTNHTDIGTLYLSFALGAGFLGLMLSVLIRIELATLGNGIFENNFQLYNSIVIAHALIMIFFVKKNQFFFRINKCLIFII